MSANVTFSYYKLLKGRLIKKYKIIPLSSSLFLVFFGLRGGSQSRFFAGLCDFSLNSFKSCLDTIISLISTFLTADVARLFFTELVVDLVTNRFFK